MRPTRLLLSVVLATLTVLLSLYSILISRPRGAHSASAAAVGASGPGFHSFLSFHAPTSLFPPSAIISLTDDNSTFFLSRPAAYGPILPSHGLSGPLWIGSGFVDDTLVQDIIKGKSEGEFGCSDIPGWPQQRNPYHESKADVVGGSKVKKAREEAYKSEDGLELPSKPVSGDYQAGRAGAHVPEEDDGSDNHLHYPLPGTTLARVTAKSKEAKAKGQQPSEHADIQSLQESAEIAGKVVLLSRGGCGFLEKTKWAQRRGGVALIVGDNTRGGPLVNMYAHEDTTNISIPSLFTSHTTAHLLASLIPTEAGGDGLIKTTGVGMAGQEEKSTNEDATKPANDGIDGPNFTPVAGPHVPTSTPRAGSSAQAPDRTDLGKTKPNSWLKKILSDEEKSAMGHDSRRPPSSGQLDWVQSNDWNDDFVKHASDGAKKDSSGKSASVKTAASDDNHAKQKGSSDGFVIGVQDWRDPDLVNKGDAEADLKRDAKATSSTKPPTPASTKIADKNPLPGGSRTPGSGVYNKPHQEDRSGRGRKEIVGESPDAKASVQRLGWFETLFGHQQRPKVSAEKPQRSSRANEDSTNPSTDAEIEGLISKHKGHHGLWVTLTPTSVSTSPFLDTLLVLVVSPLVTLTVVYALLLLRSRIRRRRWRAPKSVVDRLPVRTYHTMSSTRATTSARSSHLPSPEDSSPTSPLLRSVSTANLGRSRPRPRSHTLSVLRQDAGVSLERATRRLELSDDGDNRPRDSEAHEKEAASTSPRKYRGRQVECVVCLEEYVDGQSRVMSLPCGHEFHAECMYVFTFSSFSSTLQKLHVLRASRS